jgi:hypothetical protein
MNENSAQQSNLDQDAHDERVAQMSREDIAALAERLSSLARSKSQSTEPQMDEQDYFSPGRFDAIERAMHKHPGLTREKAQQMMDEFGF